ncbi:NADH dehydrogenase [ubiquinone] 1 alpha subcomplex subunit 6 [Olea europaea subsp. europaea]|uniref:NADH dehydrogenase [ubiquinone] 1 alpha subcomplex subunit 6 n=1 Tax=Olea europaea subsp. europaea TaxID=158383 RepID=A0A8S0VD78_OLEEU|nr:NADH dehydrogenase [ubiquinone] 1 alpha subcomplex subunit 6 [Olea europaea subsp. europaea]
MASTVKYVRVPPNSANMEAARKRVFEFFKTACRSIPTFMDIYVLDDVVKPSQLRSTVASEIRKNAHVTEPKMPSI